LDVATLRGFVARAKQHDKSRSLSREVHAVPLAFADPQLEHPRTHRLPVARESDTQTVELNENPRFRTRIPQLRHPLIERNHAIGTAKLADLDHWLTVACRLRSVNRELRAPALEASDVQDGWLHVTKALKGRCANAPVRAPKNNRRKRLPLDPELAAWIEWHVPRERRLCGGLLFENPGAYNRNGRWTPTSMRRTWEAACAAVGPSPLGE